VEKPPISTRSGDCRRIKKREEGRGGVLGRRGSRGWVGGQYGSKGLAKGAGFSEGPEWARAVSPDLSRNVGRREFDFDGALFRII
jgi:hypothetical protein